MNEQRRRQVERRARLHFIDGLRGVAATLVAVYHFNLVGETTLPGASQAVDFFLALSGLMLGLAYTERLGNGLSVARFTESRVLRLYPLYAIGTVLGIAREAAKIGIDDPNAWSVGQLAATSGFALLMLPDPVFFSAIYPLDTPCWSLLFQLLATVAFAVLLVRLSTRMLLVIVGVALVALTACGIAWGSFRFGDYWSGFGVAMLRVAAMFTMGVLCARIATKTAPRPSWWTLPVLAAFLAMLAWPWASAVRWLPDLLFVAVATPAVLLFGTRCDVPPSGVRLFGWLGDISYPIYTLHAPLLFAWHMVARRLHLSLVVEVAVFVAMLLAVSTALVPVDAVIRRRIGEWLKLRRSAMPQVIAHTREDA